MTSEALEQRILAYTQDAGADDFGALALALFEHQYLSFPLYRRRCEELGVTPATVSNWRGIPTAVASEPVAQPSAGFVDALVRAALPDLIGSGGIALVIDLEAQGGADAVIGALATHASEKSFVSRGRLAARPLRSWLGARQRDRLAVEIVSTHAGFHSLTDLLDRRGLKFRLPPASKAFCVTPPSEVGESAWESSLGGNLGIHPEAYRRVICRPASTPLLEGIEAAGVFPLPHWVRATGDSESALLDLASIGAPAHRIEPGLRGAGGDTDNLILA